jgi:hypothetical protein
MPGGDVGLLDHPLMDILELALDLLLVPREVEIDIGQTAACFFPDFFECHACASIDTKRLYVGSVTAIREGRAVTRPHGPVARACRRSSVHERGR